MEKQKFDGVIEAARCTRKGQIEFVRAYERRGFAFSDCVLLDRKTLLERLKARRRFVTGIRRNFLGGTFEPAREVMLLNRDGREVIATRPDAAEDMLEGVPLI